MLQCKYLNARILFKIEDKIIQFLMGLNDRYQGVRSQVLLMGQVPIIKKVHLGFRCWFSCAKLAP